MVYQMIKYVFSFWLVRWLMVLLIIMLFALITKVSNVGYILTMLLFYKYLTSIFLWQYFSSEERRAFSFCFIRCYKNLHRHIYFGDIQEYAKYRFPNYCIQFDLVWVIFPLFYIFSYLCGKDYNEYATVTWSWHELQQANGITLQTGEHVIYWHAWSGKVKW